MKKNPAKTFFLSKQKKGRKWFQISPSFSSFIKIKRAETLTAVPLKTAFSREKVDKKTKK